MDGLDEVVQMLAAFTFKFVYGFVNEIDTNCDVRHSVKGVLKAIIITLCVLFVDEGYESADPVD